MPDESFVAEEGNVLLGVQFRTVRGKRKGRKPTECASAWGAAGGRWLDRVAQRVLAEGKQFGKIVLVP